MNSLTAFLLDVSTTVSSGSGEAATQSTQQASGGLFGNMNGITLVIIYCVALVIIMYFLSFRPTQKREKALAEQRNAIQIGDMVVTNAGSCRFGTLCRTRHPVQICKLCYYKPAILKKELLLRKSRYRHTAQQYN